MAISTNSASAMSTLSGATEDAPQITVVVPVLNERESLPLFHRELLEVLKSLEIRFEVIYVDDGSRDGSQEFLRGLSAEDSRVRLLEFVRNFGQTAAMAAGFDHARGPVIIPLDADFQNDPADIPSILGKLAEGYDVVSCWRIQRQDPWFTRVLPSRIANWIISRISGVHLHDYGCTLKGYRREVLRHVRLYGEMHRFIPIFASWAGAKVVEIPVRHHPRRFGKSKYGMLRTVKVILDLITIKFLGTFSTKPMYLFGGAGLVAFVLGTCFSGVTLFQKFVYEVKAHRNPLLLLSIFFFIVGVQFILFGLIAELIVRTYHETQGKPTYILKESPSSLSDPSLQ